MTKKTASPGTHLGMGESKEPGALHLHSLTQSLLRVGAVWKYRCPDLWDTTRLSRGLASGGMSRICPVPCVLGGHVTRAGLGWGPVVQFVGLASVRIKNALVCSPGLWPWIAGTLCLGWVRVVSPGALLQGWAHASRVLEVSGLWFARS